MALTSAEHAAVQRGTKERRNAGAQALRVSFASPLPQPGTEDDHGRRFVGAFRKSASKAIVAWVSTFEGRVYLNVGQWYLDVGGWHRSKERPLSVRADQVEGLQELVARLQEAARLASEVSL